jgi:hypothetical protein
MEVEGEGGGRGRGSRRGRGGTTGRGGGGGHTCSRNGGRPPRAPAFANLNIGEIEDQTQEEGDQDEARTETEMEYIEDQSPPRRQRLSAYRKNFDWASDAPRPKLTPSSIRALVKLTSIMNSVARTDLEDLVNEVISTPIVPLEDGRSLSVLLRRMATFKKASAFMDFLRIVDFIELSVKLDR